MTDLGALKELIKKKAEELESTLISVRRAIHQNPELAFEEHETAALLASRLEEAGIKAERGIGGTGVVGRIQPEKDGVKCVAIRGDMDALPIQEATGLEFASQNKGKMHACGHDANCAMALGAALILNSDEIKPHLNGNVRVLFQPAEESPPGGAIKMIEAGALDNPKVDAIIASHTYNDANLGEIVFKDGPMLASADNFDLKIIGKASHGAMPQQGKDAIVTAAEVILAYQRIISRQIAPTSPAVITIGTISGGDRSNVIPSEVKMRGTVRTLDMSVKDTIRKAMYETADGITKSAGLSFELDYQDGYPTLLNDPGVKKTVQEAIGELGTVKFIEMQSPIMGGEDFAYYTHRAAGLFMFIGVVSSRNPKCPMHHPQYTIDERVLPLGASVMAYAAAKILMG
ncbi:MAG: amidohydrolase [Candidatus Coatesbacteria bacterium]|nr:amidohydrolase [Candidatus Coatesbacteria bacterium]